MVSYTQIPNLPPALAANDGTLFECVQAGTSMRITAAQIAAYVAAKYPPPGVTSVTGVAPISTAGSPAVQVSLQVGGVTNVYLASMAANRVKANITGGPAAPQDVTASQVLDLIGNVRGNVLYRGVAGWQVLAPGTPGFVLSTLGPGADPRWVDPSFPFPIVDPPLFLNSGTLSLGIVPVTLGGTNRATLTSNAILYGLGTASVGMLAPGTTGQVLTGSTGNPPAWSAATSVAVTSWSAGTTGLTPSSPTQGAVVLGGTLGVPNGGTGLTSVSADRLLIGAGTGPLQSIPAGITGQVLVGVTGGPPQWQAASAFGVTSFSAGATGLTPSSPTVGAVVLGGVLDVDNGGTGVTTLPANQVLLGNGTSGVTAVAAGLTGQVLVGNTGGAPTWSTFSSFGVTTWSGGTTGLTPNVATSGAVTLAGVLAQTNGGTGANTNPPLGAIIFQGATTSYGYDGSNLNWNNTFKTLGIGATAPGSSSWRTLIKSFGINTYPLVIQNGANTTIWYVGEDGTANAFQEIHDAGNNPRVKFNSAGASWLAGGVVGINTTAPVAWADVRGTTGVLSPAQVLYVGSGGLERFARHGILNVLDTGGATVNQAPFIVSNYNTDPNSFYTLYLNPFGPTPGVPRGVVIGHQRTPPAAVSLDVAQSISLADGELTYTPYNGTTNTNTIRAGVKYAGTQQEVQIFTANTYRGAFQSNGNLYWGGYIGVGMIPTFGWSALIQTTGDLSLLQSGGANAVIWNGYYDGANYRRQSADGFAMWRTEPSTDVFQMWIAPPGTAGGTFSPTAAMTVDTTTGNIAIGGTSTNRRLNIFGNSTTEVASYTGNANGGANAYAASYVDVSAVANGYASLTVYVNAGNPVAKLSTGSGVLAGIFYDAPAANAKHAFFIGGVERFDVLNNAIFATVPYQTNTTGGNIFGNVLVQGIAGSAGYIRTIDNVHLNFGVNNANYLSIYPGGTFWYPLVDNYTENGGSVNRWKAMHAFQYSFYGSSSGFTNLFAQPAAANNAVILPPYNGTLLIGGTQLSNALSADVALNNTGTYFNGPAIALPAGGVWFVTSTITVDDYNGAAHIEARIIDGTNVLASSIVTTANTSFKGTITLSAFVNGGLTATMQAVDITSVFGRILATTQGGGSGQSNASTMRAFRVQ